MMKDIKKFESLNEMNGFLQKGVTVYSIANCGNIWFVEYNTDMAIKSTTESTKNKRSLYEAIEFLIQKEAIKISGIYKGNRYEIVDKLLVASILSEYKNDLKMIIKSFEYYWDREFIESLMK